MESRENRETDQKSETERLRETPRDTERDPREKAREAEGETGRLEVRFLVGLRWVTPVKREARFSMV
jgi:hypothetical protein